MENIKSIRVDRIKPTTFQSFKKAVISSPGKMAGWIWNNVTEIANWISRQKDKIVIKYYHQRW